MVRRSLIPVWIGILFLSGMFLMGQEGCGPVVPSGPMVQIPAGCFNMGDAFDEHTPFPVHNVCISAYEMDVHEVTNAEYKVCVDAGRCTAPYYSWSESRET